MKTISVPPPDVEEAAESANYTSEQTHHPLRPVHPQSQNNQANPVVDVNRLFRQMELKLESVVERLLVSKVGEDDNVLASVQGVMERIFVRSAMRMADGNISRAAKLLGINRNTLSKKLRAIETDG